MNLREQIYDITSRWLNKAFADNVSFPRTVDSLCIAAFMTQHPEDTDVRAIRKAAQLLHSPGYVADDEPGVTDKPEVNK